MKRTIVLMVLGEEYLFKAHFTLGSNKVTLRQFCTNLEHEAEIIDNHFVLNEPITLKGKDWVTEKIISKIKIPKKYKTDILEHVNFKK